MSKIGSLFQINSLNSYSGNRLRQKAGSQSKYSVLTECHINPNSQQQTLDREALSLHDLPKTNDDYAFTCKLCIMITVVGHL